MIRPHYKSHTGCKQCKRRKVKCDECLPSCRRCSQRGEQCSYLEFRIFKSQSVGNFQHDSRPSTPATDAAREYMSSPSSRGIQSPDIGTISLMDVEMTHFFSTRTYKTLMFRPEGQLLWRDVIFECSLRQPALFQGILTTAMLHKIALSDSPDNKQRYTGPALKKQGDALKSFITILNQPSPSNCEALLCLSMLLTIWAFASKHLPLELNILHQSLLDGARSNVDDQASGLHSSVEDYVKIVGISQGVYAVIKETLEWLENRAVNEFMRECDMNTLPAIGEDVDGALRKLENYLEAIRRTPGTDSTHLSVAELDLFSNQIHKLRPLFRFSQRPEWHEKIVGWSIMLPNHFVQTLKQRNPASLTILAYWAACFYALDDLWWVRGWPKALVVDICSIVQEPWKQFLEWPAQLLTAE